MTNTDKKALFRIILPLLVTAAVLAFVVFEILPGGNKSSDKSEPKKADEISLSTPDGRNITLSGLLGKNVLVNFWATTCPPCVSEMPEIQAAYEKYKDEGFYVLAVNVSESGGTVKSFMDKNGYTFETVLDSEGQAASKYGVYYIPLSVFVNKEGYIVARHQGGMTSGQILEYMKLFD